MMYVHRATQSLNLSLSLSLSLALSLSLSQSVMGDVLPKENLCEKENRERLPSPQELQGKIILKGSFKLQRAGVSVHTFVFTQSF